MKDFVLDENNINNYIEINKKINNKKLNKAEKDEKKKEKAKLIQLEYTKNHE